MRWAALGAGGSASPSWSCVVAARLFELLGWLPGTRVGGARAGDAAVASPRSRRRWCALALLFALAWLVVRPRRGGRPPRARRRDEPEAAVALALLLSVEVLAALDRQPVRRAAAGAGRAPLPADGAAARDRTAGCCSSAAVASALLLPVLVLLYYGARLDLGADLDALPAAAARRADDRCGRSCSAR